MSQDIPRSMPYNMPSMPPHVDPMLLGYRLGMYAPGSRERLELELEMDKRERDARERELRERELREMEIREKMKAEMEMKPPGLERLMPPGANPLDPQWLELQRRFGGGGIPSGIVPIQGSGHPGNPHIPGVYPPSSLASDLMAREREKQDRLGLQVSLPFLTGEQVYQREMERVSAERFQAERMASDPVLRMQMAAAMHAHMHTHAHSHTHLHVHPQDGLPWNGNGSPHPLTGSPQFPHLYPPLGPGADPMSSLLGQSAAAAAAAAPGAGTSAPHPLSCLPPGMAPPHVIPGSREHELLQRELYSRMYVDPAVAHQLSAQAHHDALQRQLAIDRERYGATGHLPPH
ncbi:arginine-glutamic acid dipeptide repeats protein-like [Gigantopelta aegis]|uniref:arginine-glutamic acid dipeptide repeats protein-like n=1 Tax=Gigantopelta aegis TaxID=1735272 RepID=UPI001B887730|nr:arginine-glutamic acid dipeptide repeats protein-like [Gigantopelta aegis]